MGLDFWGDEYLLVESVFVVVYLVGGVGFQVYFDFWSRRGVGIYFCICFFSICWVVVFIQFFWFEFCLAWYFGGIFIFVSYFFGQFLYLVFFLRKVLFLFRSSRIIGIGRGCAGGEIKVQILVRVFSFVFMVDEFSREGDFRYVGFYFF